MAAALAAGADEVVIRVGRLRILVQVFHVRVRRRAVEIKVAFLDVFAMVAFVVRQPEQPLLDDRVLAVPERQRKAEDLAVVADPSEPVLPPAVGARAGLIVRKVVPGVTVFAVVFPNRSPLPFPEVRTPLAPRR